MSEAMLAMVLDIEVDRHKREVAEGFAKLKAKLPPEPTPGQNEAMHFNRGLSNELLGQINYLQNMCMARSGLEYVDWSPDSAWPVVNGGIFFPSHGRWF